MQALSGEAARRGKQGLSRLSRLAVSVKYSEENSVLIRIYSLKWVGRGERLFEFDWEDEGVGAY